MTSARLCTHCREPLPPRSGRGRPATTHPGDCRRLATNKKRLHGRAQRFIESLDNLPPIDRSDGTLPGAVSRADVDASELYDETGALSGYSITPAPWRPTLENKEFLELMQAYEEEEAHRARLGKHKKTLVASDPELLAKVTLIPPIPYDDYMETLRRNPKAKPSPAFEYYAANREELDAAQEEYFRRLLDLEDAAVAKRKRPKVPA